MSVEIIKGDARAMPLPDESVDLIVTSPPYFGLRSYQDGGEHYDGQLGAEPTPAEFVEALIDATDEATRVLKRTGSLWVNLGDKYANAGNRSKGRTSLQGATDRARPVVPRKAGLDGCGTVPAKSLMGVPWRYALRCIDELDLILRAEVVWSKPNPMPESVTDRVKRSHETWFHFTRGPRYFSNLDAVREAYAESSPATMAAGYRDTGRAGQRLSTNYETPETLTPNPKGKLPGSVRQVANRPLRVPPDLGVKHYAAFPLDWPAWIIAGWCPDGGTVLDPFGGSGTTALAADVMGRHGITVDLSSDYCRLAEWRTTDPRQRKLALEAVARVTRA